MARAPVAIELAYTPPLDWDFFLGYLTGRLTAGVEQIADGRYTRAVELGGDTGTISLAHHPDRLVVTVRGAVKKHADVIRGRVRRMFDLDVDPAAVRAALGRDARIGPLLTARPGVRVPGAWSGFELLIRTIVGQQVSVRAATTIMGRIAGRLGRTVPGPDGEPPVLLFPTPESLAADSLDAIGMPGQRVRAVRAVARAAADGVISFPEPGGDTAGMRDALLGLPGIGPWTVEYFAMRGLRDADAWPGSDLVLRRAVGPAGTLSDGWRPYRAYAAMHLWHHAATAAKQTDPAPRSTEDR